MTDEGMGPFEEPTPEPEGMMRPEGERPASAMAADFTSGEGLVALGGLVVVAGYIIFEVIVAEYFTNWLILLLAIAAAVLPRLNRETVEKVHPLAVMMKTLGYALGILGVLALINDLRFENYDDFASVLGALALYAGAALALVGARQIKI